MPDVREGVPLGVWEDDILADFLPLLNKLPQFPKESAVCREVSRRDPDLLGILASALATGECQVRTGGLESFC